MALAGTIGGTLEVPAFLVRQPLWVGVPSSVVQLLYLYKAYFVYRKVVIPLAQP